MDPPGPTQPTQATSGRSLVAFKSPWSFGTEVPKAASRRKQVGSCLAAAVCQRHLVDFRPPLKWRGGPYTPHDHSAGHSLMFQASWGGL